MDRYDTPSLFVPAICSLIASVFLVIGYKSENMPDMFRALCVAIGIVFLFLALATGIDWLVWQVAEHMQRITDAKPQVRYAALVKGMSLEQLDALTLISPFLIDVRLRTANGAVEAVKTWRIDNHGKEIPFWWLEEFFSKCAEEYPYIPPQHGIPDNTERQYRKWFIDEMVKLELATAPTSNQAAQWRKPLGDILQLLELT